MKLLIIIPAYNEAENIENVVKKISTICPQYDYVIINDGSKDDTAKICKERGYNLLDLPINLGLAGGVQAGLKFAYEHDYDYAIQFDGDGQHEPQYIEEMLKCMIDNQSDIIIGSRFVESKKPHTLRMAGSNILQTVIRLTTGVNITDPTSGMRLFNRKMMKQFAYSMNYGPEPDTISYLLRCGAKVEEVQVRMLERQAGESYLNLRRSIEYMFRMCVSIILIQRFRKKNGVLV